jgi:hypothetical protein
MKGVIDVVAKTPLPTIPVIAGGFFSFSRSAGRWVPFSTKGLQRASPNTRGANPK